VTKRVVLTGATGFVGANLTRRLLREGHDVYLLIRQGYVPWRIKEIQSAVHLHEVNFLDRDALLAAIIGIRPDWIFHLAAYGAYSTQTDLGQMIQANIVSTANLLDACLHCGFETFVNFGSSSEYGLKDHPPSETDWVDPNSHYAVTKSSATMLCRYTAIRHKVPIITLRLYSVFGPYEEPTRLMPTIIVRGLEGKLPPLVNPAIARDYIYSEDVNEACLLAASTMNQELGAVYNLGTGVQTSLQEVVEYARRILNISVEPKWGSMPNRQWDTTVWVSNNLKICTTLGWQPRYTFEQGFVEMVNWIRNNEALHNYYRTSINLR
jgi:UDP-glucose 4-epimerase